MIIWFVKVKVQKSQLDRPKELQITIYLIIGYLNMNNTVLRRETVCILIIDTWQLFYVKYFVLSNEFFKIIIIKEIFLTLCKNKVENI